MCHRVLSGEKPSRALSFSAQEYPWPKPAPTSSTTSPSPSARRCYRKVEAKIVFQDDNVYLLKRCPQHGSEKVLIADDVDYYRRCREIFIKPPEMPLVYNTPVKWGCPYDCGLCTDHEQHSCLTLVEICDYCNLRCPVCYADSGPERQQFRDLRQIEKMLDAVVRNEGHPDVVQLSGGEPTVHPDFFEIVEMAKARPIRHLMVNTNGVRIAQEEEFVKRLADYKEDFEVYLQFDSFEREPLMQLRGADLRRIREDALEKLNRYNIHTNLVVTVKKGLNDHEIGKTIDYALQQPCVRGVTFQPIQDAGRLDRFQPRHRPPDPNRSPPQDPRADHCLQTRRRDPRSLPSRLLGDGLRVKAERQSYATHQHDPAGGPDQRRQEHHPLRTGARHPRRPLQTLRHQSLPRKQRGNAARTPLLPPQSLDPC